jgi:drug/metabolite transporter (DMT)-like permease
MTILPIWFPPAMIALAIWGITAFLPKIALRALAPFPMIVYSSFFFLIGAGIMQLIFGMPEFDLTGIYYALATGACGTFGQILYLYALKRGPVTYVSMISSLYPLVATMLAVTLLNDHVTVRQGFGVALGIASIILLVRADDK